MIKRKVKTEPKFKAKIVLKVKAWRERMYHPGDSFIDEECYEGKYKPHYGKVLKIGEEESKENPEKSKEKPKDTGEKGLEGLV